MVRTIWISPEPGVLSSSPYTRPRCGGFNDVLNQQHVRTH